MQKRPSIYIYTCKRDLVYTKIPEVVVFDGVGSNSGKHRRHLLFDLALHQLCITHTHTHTHTHTQHTHTHILSIEGTSFSKSFFSFFLFKTKSERRGVMVEEEEERGERGRERALE